MKTFIEKCEICIIDNSEVKWDKIISLFEVFIGGVNPRLSASSSSSGEEAVSKLLEKVKMKLMGHADFGTTQKYYIFVSDARKKQEYEQLQKIWLQTLIASTMLQKNNTR